jgi:coenzyme F420 hydrogenase subunit beta
MKLLRHIIKAGLCLGCGTCAGICPKDAITMKLSKELHVPEIDETKCNKCGVCFLSCPGHSVNFADVSFKVFNERYKPSFIGNYNSCYIGYSNDKQIRFNSASGGLVTELLIFALENEIIDGVITTRMQTNNPLETEAFIARTPKEIIEASKSKYCPVTPNVCLKQVLNENGRFATVGLPCHIHGIRKAEMILKVLEKKIVLRLGLLCSHTVGFAGNRFLLKKLGFDIDEIAKISYRGEGWPGSMSIETKTGSIMRVPLFGSWNSYWPFFSSFFFTPLRCTMCPDQTAELADISFGDAWLPEFKREKNGMSIIISRSKIGESLLKKATLAKRISLTNVSIEKVNQSQSVNLKFKKNDLQFRLSFLDSIGKKTPKFSPLFSNPRSFIAALRGFYIFANIKASSNKFFKLFLYRIPNPLIRAYYGIYKLLSVI